MRREHEDKSAGPRAGHGGAQIVPGCGCTLCLRIAAYELDLAAPFTPADWRRIEVHCGLHQFSGPPPVDLDVASDPAVAAATDALAAAELRFTTADDAWRDSIGELREAELLASSIDDDVAAKARGAVVRLRDALREAGELRDAAWRGVVKQRTALDAASRTAQQQAIHAGAFDTKTATAAHRKTAAEASVRTALGLPAPPADGGPDHTGLTRRTTSRPLPPVHGGPDLVSGGPDGHPAALPHPTHLSSYPPGSWGFV